MITLGPLGIAYGLFGWLAEAGWLAGWQQLQPSLLCPAIQLN